MNQGSKWGVMTSAFISISVGIFLFLNLRTNLMAISWLLSVSVLFNGIAGLYFYRGLPSLAKSLWLLLAAGLEILIGAYLLLGGFLNLPVLIPTILGIWLVVLSLIRFGQALGLRKEVPILTNYLFWSSMLGVVLGFFLINHPMVGGGVAALLVASAFVYAGLVQLMKVLNS
ncbi:DUF308 domain-containing protein [Streptococcus sp. NLN64]|uniref:DUF308 domain-containing protein n=1 Tax=Streptococcus sp. NLN64 TaxID=2822799 RepID=UPI0018CB1EAB|nr:DUF308 domain-containing protein [Streptococcus sp. NLN64]MBG9366639.1 DUF308 domain-containing protein [Streptococcus sp. NLN64]